MSKIAVVTGAASNGKFNVLIAGADILRTGPIAE